MLSKQHRFHGYGRVRAIYAKGRTVRGGQLGLKAVHHKSAQPFRAAVVVSRKVHKSAVVRNRIRRRVYEAIRTSAAQPPPGTDLVFTAYSEQLAEMPSDKLQALVNDLLRKAIES